MVPSAFDQDASSYDRLVGANPGYSDHLKPLGGATRPARPGRGPAAARRRLRHGALDGRAARDLPGGGDRRGRRLRGDAGAGAGQDVARECPLRALPRRGARRARRRGPFDGILAAYLLRNLPDVDAASATCTTCSPRGAAGRPRVLGGGLGRRAGGVDRGVLGDRHPAGWRVTGDASLYRYLWRSVLAFDGVARLRAGCVRRPRGRARRADGRLAAGDRAHAGGAPPQVNGCWSSWRPHPFTCAGGAPRRSARRTRCRRPTAGGAAHSMSGRTRGCTRRAWTNPSRSECATTASVTCVRARPSGCGASGVAWVSTTLPAPSPRVMCMTTVRGSGQVKRASTGIPQLLRDPERDVQVEVVLVGRGGARRGRVDAQVGERVGMEPGAVPGVEAVRDDVVGLAGPDHRRHRDEAGPVGRADRQDRGVGGLLAADGVEPDPRQHPVVVGRQRPPPGAARRAEREAVPAADELAPGLGGRRHVRAQVRAGARPGEQLAGG